ncbi:hypothetical protein BDB01DRAFT_770923 [Pilobolus umbonatus]|nr:hypothetical protein BDB01DRAFT_770923 [Pilobolus umbonatus]
MATTLSHKPHFTQERWKQVNVLSELPKFYTSEASSTQESKSNKHNTFRTSSCRQDDPELLMGDNCDSLYEQVLLNSDFLDLLQKKETVKLDLFLSPESKANGRLRMLLAHVNQSLILSSIHQSSQDNRKITHHTTDSHNNNKK